MRALSSITLLLTILLGVGACNPWSSRCEDLCSQLKEDCNFSAWATSEQCRQGCVDDMYRRDDAEELFACYERAVAVPSADEAIARVAQAQQAGLFDKAIEAGSWDQASEEARAIELGTCDLFAFVQCKVEAVQVAPQLPLLGDEALSP